MAFDRQNECMHDYVGAEMETHAPDKPGEMGSLLDITAIACRIDFA